MLKGIPLKRMSRSDTALIVWIINQHQIINRDLKRAPQNISESSGVVQF